MNKANIASLFEKDIARPIEGVIKADDTRHLAAEVDEYVLTGETASALEQLLEAYTEPVYGGGNGVWISGFFGSGKSHLLKMLAHLLGEVPDQELIRQSVVETFCTKAGIAGAMLTALIKKSATVSATSLLFNIDQKAPLIDKSQTDALLQVFVKVFNESRGYYGGEPSVARFERDLDRRNLLQDFKDKFQEIAGVPWEQGREEGILSEQAVTQAWAEIADGQTTENILARYESQFTLSIEDFAEEVTEWLRVQEPNHRLLFLVDEVGQFIGADTKLMLNLQTIVETLHTKCDGRAWVFVTSQEDMDSVIGDRTKQQDNDFSKIQARFKTRMKLTSADVEEVIQRRLLEKNKMGETELRALYEKQHANFRTLFDFVDGERHYRNYADCDDFTGLYPFVPYQFPFFQEALRGLSDHNVFEGRHSSVGERSMLGVVQEVTQKLADAEVGSLVPFDKMLDGIRQTVKSAAIKNLATAERQLPQQLPNGSEIAVRLLKALFLVKYIRGYIATPRNLAVLLYDKFDTNLTVLNTRVAEALEVLESQTYVQRNGIAYEYLTNEEQEIEQEIKNVDIDTSEVAKLLFGIISGDIVKSRSFPHNNTGQQFQFGFKLDEVAQGIQKPLTVHFMSPLSGLNETEIAAHSMGLDEVRIVLANDEKLYEDLRLQIQTEKYAKRKRSTSLTESVSHILDTKVQHNAFRRKDLVDRIRKAIQDGYLVVNGTKLNTSGSDPETKIANGFNQLITRTYTQLGILGGATYAETGIAEILSKDPELFSAIPDKLTAPADEVLAYIISQRKLGTNVTVRLLTEHFEEKPYGWPLAAVLSAIARLFASAKISLSTDGSILKRTEVAEMLRNGSKRPHIVVDVQKTYDLNKTQDLRLFAYEFFDEANLPSDPLELAVLVRDRLSNVYERLVERRNEIKRYPFLESLGVPIELLGEVIGREPDFYINDFGGNIAELLDAKEDVIDPIRQFMAGSQREIFDNALDWLAGNQSNTPYLESSLVCNVNEMLTDKSIFRGQGAKRLKDAYTELAEACKQLVDDEKTKQQNEIEHRIDELKNSSVFLSSSQNAQEIAMQTAQHVLSRLEAAVQIPEIKQLGSDFEVLQFPQILDQLTQSYAYETHASGSSLPASETVSIKMINQPKPVSVLETDEDVEQYLSALREVLIDAIKSGKRISL